MNAIARTGALVGDFRERAGLAARLATCTVGSWRWRQVLVALAAGIAAAVVIGAPTDMITTALYHRMTPVQGWNYLGALSLVLLAVALRQRLVPRICPGPIGVGAGR